ncbi:aquaporin [Kitasatospora sp. NPDC091335]|uniref:aquaporin n=1 Tax=Kitasatospora sp. NPDC091335 TaxID=3364085 RepID=UPI0037FB49CE
MRTRKPPANPDTPSSTSPLPQPSPARHTPRSGGSANPARQFGPALLSGNTTELWIHLLAPVIGASIGAGIRHALAAPAHRAHTRHTPGTGSGSG